MVASEAKGDNEQWEFDMIVFSLFFLERSKSVKKRN